MCLSVCVSVVPFSIPTRPTHTFYLFTYLFIYSFIYLFIYLFMYLSIYVSIYLSIYLSIYPSIQMGGGEKKVPFGHPGINKLGWE